MLKLPFVESEVVGVHVVLVDNVVEVGDGGEGGWE
jgi:hypothetical protein